MNIERAIAGEMILEVFIPKDFNANNSELLDNFPYANNVESKTAIGNDKTKKLGKLKKRTFKARNKGNPNSTIFLMRSNITPTDSEITVNAEIANIIGGMIWPNNHLSIKGIEYQGVIIFLIFFFNSDLFENFKSSLFNLYCFFLNYKISMIQKPIKNFKIKNIMY